MGSNKENSVKDIESLSFEECYSELQELVEKFERGQMPLTQSVERFERGILLLKRCNAQLSDAEKRVEKLLRRIEPEPYSEQEDLREPDGEDQGYDDIPF